MASLLLVVAVAASFASCLVNVALEEAEPPRPALLILAIPVDLVKAAAEVHISPGMTADACLGLIAAPCSAAICILIEATLTTSVAALSGILAA